MIFEWDEDKNRSNIEKHGISFEQASKIFGGPIVDGPDYRNDYDEARSIAFGRNP